MSKKIKKIKTEWDLSPLLDDKNQEKIKKEMKQIEKAYDRFAKKWRKNKNYLKKPQILKEALDEYENLFEKYYGSTGKTGYYFWLMSQKASNDPKIKAGLNKIEEFGIEQSNKIKFFIISLQKLPKEKRGGLFESPVLKKYHKFLDNLDIFAPYKLDEKVEKALSLKSPLTYSNWVRMRSSLLANEEREIIDEDGKEKKKSYSEIMELMSSQKKEVRDSAVKAFNDILEKFIDVAENEFNSILQNHKIDDEMRGYEDQLHKRLLRDKMRRKDVSRMIETVTSSYNISKKYYKLKAKLLGTKKLKYHERNVPIGEVSKKIKFNEACNLINNTFESLDKEFSEIFKKFLEYGHIDVYPQKGKTDSQFCAYHNKLPIYIQLNYTGKLSNVTTVAHEMGHAINFELMEVQPNLYYGTTTSMAEIASTFMEDFVFEKLLEKADEKEKLTLMMDKLNDEVSTIFRQVASHHFEYEVHNEFRKSGYVSKKKFGKLFKKHMSAYMGPGVEQSPGSENWWSYWPHLRNNFYNHTYASGQLISKILQRKVRKNPDYIKKVKGFLSKGTSQSPKDMLLEVGVNISKKETWESGLDEIEDLFKSTEKLAKKLGKI